MDKENTKNEKLSLTGLMRVIGNIGSISSIARAVIMLAAAVSIFLSLGSILTHTQSTEGLIIASKRDAAEDTLFQAIAQENKNVLYVREGDPFYNSIKQFAIEENKDASSSNLLVVRARKESGKYVAETLIATDRTGSFDELDKYASLSTQPTLESTLLPVAVVLGLLLSSLSLISRIPVYGLLSAAAILAAYQYYSFCPTCPMTTIGGIPASHIGIVLYGFIAIASVFSLLTSKSLNILAMLALTGSTAWQVIMNHSAKTACLPCVGIALLSGLCLGLLPQEQKKLGHVGKLIPIGAIAAACLLLMARDPLAGAVALNKGSHTKLSDHAFSLKGVVGRNASEIGLATTGKPAVVLVVASGCAPCHDAMQFLSKHPEVSITVAQVNTPTSQKEPNSLYVEPGVVRTTPTFLLIQKDGKIVGERIGWSNDLSWQESLLKDSEQFCRDARMLSARK